jgi:hypothetical protein
MLRSHAVHESTRTTVQFVRRKPQHDLWRECFFAG